MNSRRLYEFLELFNLEKKFKRGNNDRLESAQGGGRDLAQRPNRAEGKPKAGTDQGILKGGAVA
jgi:hypothetical protein